jgi:hypothetical protein
LAKLIKPSSFNQLSLHPPNEEKKAKEGNNGYIVIKYVFKNQLRNMLVVRSGGVVNSTRSVRRGAKTKLSANSVKKFRHCRLCSGSEAPFHQQPIKGSVCV